MAGSASIRLFVAELPKLSNVRDEQAKCRACKALGTTRPELVQLAIGTFGLVSIYYIIQVDFFRAFLF